MALQFGVTSRPHIMKEVMSEKIQSPLTSKFSAKLKHALKLFPKCDKKQKPVSPFSLEDQNMSLPASSGRNSLHHSINDRTPYRHSVTSSSPISHSSEISDLRQELAEAVNLIHNLRKEVEVLKSANQNLETEMTKVFQENKHITSTFGPRLGRVEKKLNESGPRAWSVPEKSKNSQKPN